MITSEWKSVVTGVLCDHHDCDEYYHHDDEGSLYAHIFNRGWSVLEFADGNTEHYCRKHPPSLTTAVD